MEKIGEGHHEDLVRAFFRLRVADLGRFLPHIVEEARKLLNDAPDTRIETISDTNVAILVRLLLHLCPSL